MKYFKEKVQKEDLKVYFTKFKHYKVIFSDNTTQYFYKTSYYSLRQFISEYYNKQVEDVIELDEVQYIINYRKTSKAAFDYITNLRGAGVLAPHQHFNPQTSSLFPYFKILNK